MTKTVAGRPVEGEVSYYRGEKADQKSVEEFVAALDEIFAYPEVEAVRWRQCTPYFNDGDPCVFHFGEFSVKLTDGDPDGGDYEDGFLGEYSVNSHYGGGHDCKNPHPLAAALETHLGYNVVKAYEDAAEAAFGDPAEVTATRDGFNVESYEHD